MIRLGFVLIVAISLTTIWLLVPAPSAILASEVASPSSAVPELSSDPVTAGRSQYLGVGSCAAMACHGGAGTTGAKGCEYTTWSNNDPHARAFAVLYDPLAVNITKNLGIAEHPTKVQQCLVCHVTGPTSAATLTTATSPGHINPLDGVGCESCHGAAKDWIGLHTSAAWVNDQVSAPEKARYGLIDISNPEVQVKVCMSCHVGSPEQDVNHSLLGAGHPRLFFEFAGYAASLPRHWAWKEKEKGSAAASNRARDWALGQLATASAALQLLSARANAEGTHPHTWPQFAEYDCYSCHHDLTDPSWRRLQVYAKKEGERLPWAPAKAVRGTIPWGSWYYPMLLPLARQTNPEIVPALLEKMQALDQGMLAAMNPAKSTANGVAVNAAQVLALLREWQSKTQDFAFDREWTRNMIVTLVEDKDGYAEATWDSAAQLYIALDQLLQAYGPTGGEGAADQALLEMAQVLKFPKDYRSPKTFNPAAMAKQLQAIREALHVAK